MSEIASTKTAPVWAETSVRWLRTHRPEWVPAASRKTFVAQLSDALVGMSYFRDEMMDKRKFSLKKWKETLLQQVEEWTKPRHEGMVKFIQEGGYMALKALDEKVKIAVTDEFDTKGDTELDIEMVELEDAIEAPPAKRSQISPKHELEEILANASMQADPRYGAW